MDFAATLSVVQTLSAALQSAKLREVCSVLGKKSELDHLNSSIGEVGSVIHNARARQELSHEVQLWLAELKDAVYDADDFTDAFMTLSEQKEINVEGELSEKLCQLFSSFNLLRFADNMSQLVKKVRESLDSISHKFYGFSIDCLPILGKGKNCSYVYEGDIIGREDDMGKIVDILLNSNVQQDVSILSIVGVGGVGKTALARLVYDNESVATAFPLRLWTCVSDQDQKEFNVNEILVKILRSASDQIHNECEMGRLYDKLMELIEGRKYLLVLDDVWTQNCVQWRNLVEVLKAGQKGSWIILTTRSIESSAAVGDGAIYELRGLSDESSWSLFEKTTFEEAEIPENLVKIGREIVKGCDEIPIVIRMVGSLLYGQDETKWVSLQKSVFSGNRQGNNDIVPVLKLSYYNLEPAIQSCFSYCALFPKDYEIQKDLMIDLWISQGFVVPFAEGQSIYEAGEEYFLILLQRCFFQDVKKDEYGEIVSCKMHDLIHDFAQQVAGEEISVLSSLTDCQQKRNLHLSGVKGKSSEIHLSTRTQIRSYIQVRRIDQLPMDRLVDNFKGLRTLVLRYSSVRCLPDSIDELVHLRCIDLTDCSRLERLPNSITNLHNLQVLRLRSCINLKELPKDLSKLAKLMVLDISCCYRLAYVPPDLRELSNLHTLSNFVLHVGSPSSDQHFNQLEGLKSLEYLRGHLWFQVKLPRNAVYIRKDGSEGLYLKNKKHLKHIRFDIAHAQLDAVGDNDVVLLEDLQPHSNLKGLVFSGYSSMILPSWGREDSLATFLPNLVRLEFVNCANLQYLPCLGELHHLKLLCVFSLPNLEHMEINPAGSEPMSRERQSLFPCLEELRLSGLPKLKGWQRPAGEIRDEKVVNNSGRRTGKMEKSRPLPFLVCLPQLKTLEIRECLELTSVLLCPRVEEMTLFKFNKSLQTQTSSSEVNVKGLAHPKLRSVLTDNIVWFNSLSIEIFKSLSQLSICWDELESLSEIGQILQTCSSSLRNFVIYKCCKLRSLSGGLEHLTVLETLVLEYLDNLVLTSSADGMPWQPLHQSLHSLELKGLPQVINLPQGMKYLTSLRSLSLIECDQLASLPKWIQDLKSLRQLESHQCPDLYDRYASLMGKELTWEDWPNTEHIRSVSINW